MARFDPRGANSLHWQYIDGGNRAAAKERVFKTGVLGGSGSLLGYAVFEALVDDRGIRR